MLHEAILPSEFYPPSYERISQAGSFAIAATVASTSSGSDIGMWADVAMAAADGSGAKFRVSMAPVAKQPGLLSLLETWLEEYPEAVDSKFEQDLGELESSPLKLRLP